MFNTATITYDIGVSVDEDTVVEEIVDKCMKDSMYHKDFQSKPVYVTDHALNEIIKHKLTKSLCREDIEVDCNNFSGEQIHGIIEKVRIVLEKRMRFNSTFDNFVIGEQLFIFNRWNRIIGKNENALYIIPESVIGKANVEKVEPEVITKEYLLKFNNFLYRKFREDSEHV